MYQTAVELRFGASIKLDVYDILATLVLFFRYSTAQNYNKSRIHSYRGAKDVEMTLDGTLVFRGEVARACGGIVGGSESFGDVSAHGCNNAVISYTQSMSGACF